MSTGLHISPKKKKRKGNEILAPIKIKAQANICGLRFQAESNY